MHEITEFAFDSNLAIMSTPDVQEDVQTMNQWIKARAHNTFDTYKREVEKLLNWTYANNKTLKKLTAQNASDYLADLSQNGPKPSSVKHARTILNQMFSYLCDLDSLQKISLS